MKGAGRCVERRKHVAHKLLIELLACQFAFPVRWTETQDSLLSKEDAISRFIEIGPAKILARMAKQTAETRYADRDHANSIQRRFLSSQSDQKEIRFEYELAEEKQDPPRSQTEANQTVALAIEQPRKTANSAPSSAASTQVPDVPISATEVIDSLIARKLNKGLDEIANKKSIKELAGGKSTLQNELVGILETEFSSIPPAPEDLSISQLSERIQPNFSGNLGKESARLLSRFFSSKIPAGFGQHEAREYLAETWGVGGGRQTSILLLAITAEPISRLASIDTAKEFLDSMAMQYGSITKTSLNKVTTSGGQEDSPMTLVDGKQIEALRGEQNTHLFKYFRVLAEHLGIDPSNSLQIRQLEMLEREHKSKLDLWSVEFGDEFESGIQPAFDPRKIRRFSSWWNNVTQDVISLFHEIQNHQGSIDGWENDERIQHISNRCNDFVCNLIDYQCKFLSETQPTRANTIHGFTRKISAKMADAKKNDPVFLFSHRTMAPETTVSEAGIIKYREVPRKPDGPTSYPYLLRHGFSIANADRVRPFIDVQTLCCNQWGFDPQKTETLLKSFEKVSASGISFAGHNVLVTGAGPKSIGAEVVQGLLMGGARVVVTSSRPLSESKSFYQKLYAKYGARGSELIVVPFNQSSKRDCTALIDFIYSETGLGRNLDAVIPFAAISERAEIDEIGAWSELVHRLMLINVLRILGDVVRNKKARHIHTRPTQVLLPLSPNHGIFGGDGLYAESKLGLESLLSRFYSESWSDHLHICGAVIGWTRGTELMNDNDIVAQEIESQNVLTFSQKEMAFNILTLMTDPVISMCERESILVNLNGGLDTLPDLKNLILRTRNQLNQLSNVRKAIVAENELEAEALKGAGDFEDPDLHVDQSAKRSTIKVGYPALPNYKTDIAPLCHLEGMVDLCSVPVVVGFSELGPWGSARTRWEMESRGMFSQEGYIELAWMMNIIKHYSGEKDGTYYSGWVDAKTGAKVQDSQIGDLYGRQILDHSGIRLIEPELFGGYDPEKKEYLHEVAIEEDMPEFAASQAVAEGFKLHHGDKVSIRPIESSEEFKVQLKRGASLMISKAVPFEGSVAGQIPTGWDPTKYGLPDDIVRQVDPVTAYALCCAAEALYSAGIQDASEILQYIHISEIGNFVGSMMGGITKTRNMYKDRFLDKDVQGDVMQETYLNTTAAWINMLLLGTAGPIKTLLELVLLGSSQLTALANQYFLGRLSFAL